MISQVVLLSLYLQYNIYVAHYIDAYVQTEFESIELNKDASLQWMTYVIS